MVRVEHGCVCTLKAAGEEASVQGQPGLHSMVMSEQPKEAPLYEICARVLGPASPFLTMQQATALSHSFPLLKERKVSDGSPAPGNLLLTDSLRLREPESMLSSHKEKCDHAWSRLSWRLHDGLRRGIIALQGEMVVLKTTALTPQILEWRHRHPCSLLKNESSSHKIRGPELA